MAKITGRALLWVVVAGQFAGCSSTPTTSPPLRLQGDVVSTPDPTPVSEPASATGNPESYVVFGKRYYVSSTSKDYRQHGIASWYGSQFHGKKTSSGEIFDMYQVSAAHKNLPIPTYVRVTHLGNGRSIVVKVNDRGPFVDDRLLDLSYAAAVKLDMVGDGTAPVEIVALPPYQTLPDYNTAVAKAAPVESTFQTAKADFVIEPLRAARPTPPKVEPLASTFQPAVAEAPGKPRSAPPPRQSTLVASTFQAASAAPGAEPLRTVQPTPPKAEPLTSTFQPTVAEVSGKPRSAPLSPQAAPVFQTAQSTPEPLLVTRPSPAKPESIPSVAQAPKPDYAPPPPATVRRPQQQPEATATLAGAPNLAGSERTVAVHPRSVKAPAYSPASAAPLYVQVGAFTRRNNAERLQHQLAPRLRYAIHIESDVGKLHKVQVGPLRSAAEAQKLVLYLAGMGINARPVAY